MERLCDRIVVAELPRELRCPHREAQGCEPCAAAKVVAAKIDLNQYFGGLNIIVALTIAVFKASLVVLFFMHGKYSPKRTQMVIIASIFWLGIMLFMTMSDYVTRLWS